MELGRQIKLWRKKRGWKQEQFAELIGITPTYLSKIENCRKEPTLKLIRKIVDKLNAELWITEKT